MEVEAQDFRRAGRQVRPFVESSGVRCRGRSKGLERALTDFGVDEPYVKAAAKVREHYGIDVGPSTIRRDCIRHGEQSREYAETAPRRAENQKEINAQADGCMVPCVRRNPDSGDRDLFWKEMRICAAFPQGSKTPFYAGGIIDGGVERAGKDLFHAVWCAGFGPESFVYGLGDGASWIKDQFAVQFGEQQSYLIDLYHLCEKLAEASPAFAESPDKQKDWVSCQKDRMKVGHLKKVTAALASRLEPEDVADENAPVRRCHRYILNRPGQFEYFDAIANDRPIGSGAIESANRSVVQMRMKKPGAWWRIENAEKMVALRILRANGQWDDYWAALKHDNGNGRLNHQKAAA